MVGMTSTTPTRSHSSATLPIETLAEVEVVPLHDVVLGHDLARKVEPAERSFSTWRIGGEPCRAAYSVEMGRMSMQEEQADKEQHPSEVC